MSKFDVNDLLVTQVPGMAKFQVPDATQRKNLERLIKETLDPLYAAVGPFGIESAFRSEAVNKAVGGSESSFHAQGLAADLTPQMGADAFIGKILADPKLKAMVGELIKNSSRVVHVSAPRTDKTYAVRYRSPAGNYVPYTSQELQELVKKYGGVVAAGLGSVLLVGLALYALSK